MSGPQLGVIMDDGTPLAARPDDPINLVLLRGTLLNPPRERAASSLGVRLRKVHPEAAIGVYAWHYVTHTRDDRLVTRATRTLGCATESATWGHLRDDEVGREAWSTTQRVATATGAGFIVISMPASFSPSALNRRRLRAFVESHANASQQLIWEARGLWEFNDAANLAAELGIGVAGTVADISSSGLGSRREPLWVRLETSQDADELAVLVSEADDDARPGLTVLFSGARALRDLRNFHARTLEGP